MNPYEVLGISIDADNTVIADAYLLRIWQFSPKRHPEKFKEINDAYDNWIFDISPIANNKSGYKVRHEATDAAWSVFRSRIIA